MKEALKELNKEFKKELVFATFSIKKNLLSGAELRGSFLINIFGMMINNTAFVILWMAFGKIAGNMGGWQAIDVLGQIGLGSIGFGICFTFFGGIRDLPEIISSGSFDKYMLSPKSILLRLSTSATTISAIGDFFVGVVMLLLWLYFIKANFTQIIFSIILSLCSGLLFYFFSVVVNCVAFYFVESRSIVQGLFEFLITPSMFYGGAFQGMLRFFFISSCCFLIIFPCMSLDPCISNFSPSIHNLFSSDISFISFYPPLFFSMWAS
jgi:ABC-2 type transport system permease protein